MNAACISAEEHVHTIGRLCFCSNSDTYCKAVKYHRTLSFCFNLASSSVASRWSKWKLDKKVDSFPTSSYEELIE